MDKYIHIVADTNDGDFVEQLSKISNKDLQSIVPVIEAIHTSNNSHNWMTGEMASESIWEQYIDVDKRSLDIFDEYVPYEEYGVHTIESIRVFEVASITHLL